MICADSSVFVQKNTFENAKLSYPQLTMNITEFSKLYRNCEDTEQLHCIYNMYKKRKCNTLYKVLHFPLYTLYFGRFPQILTPKIKKLQTIF